MTSSPIDELTVPYDNTQAAERVRRRGRRVRGRLISLGITLLILGGIYLWRGRDVRASGFLVLYAVVLGVSVLWLLGYLVAWLRARRALAAVGSGIALRIGRPGVEVAGAYVPWAEVASLAAVPGRLGHSPLLRVTSTSGGTWSVPFDQIDVRPATLDMTARAYSGGRHGVDLEALDS